MKLIIAILQDKDAGKAVGEVNRRGFRATKLASTGGFLREGNTTILVGVEEQDVDIVLTILRRTSASRQETLLPQAPSHSGEPYVPYPVEVTVGGATIFVVDVERYEKF
ncbi:MAG: cyclic-di-AMP receptor [Firmicutes bacterium]|nr:cyclic-di-AMP receptor [Bacillota bacterium]